jgi:DNA-binding response OmpR family regulator
MSKKALVVDDDPIILESVRGRLEAMGFDVITQEKSLGTAQLFVEKRPDLVIMDINMPMIQGDKLIAILRRELTSAVVVIHSSKPAQELSEIARRTGADGYIAKTGSDALFTEQLGQILRRKGLGLKK